MQGTDLYYHLNAIHYYLRNRCNLPIFLRKVRDQLNGKHKSLACQIFSYMYTNNAWYFLFPNHCRPNFFFVRIKVLSRTLHLFLSPDRKHIMPTYLMMPTNYNAQVSKDTE
jgi:hypothetical protein